jgi:hypothetical protein
VALELNKLTYQVGQMGQVMAARQSDHARRTADARAALRDHALVTPELRSKISAARQADESWRGADPLGEHLDERHVPTGEPVPATLMAVDGSQVYPNRHDIAPYFLINVGSIVLRQGSGQAPTVDSHPEVFYEDADLYDEAGRPRDPEYVNSQRDRREIEAVAGLAEAERAALGGDLDRLLVALVDGPLLLWTPQRISDREVSREVSHFTRQLARLRRARAVPFGYVDRPSSANILRTLELADVPSEEITRDKVRAGPFRQLTDRLLFANLAPNERTGLFASTTELNDRYAAEKHRITFFYVNVAQRPGEDSAVIARVELPAWAADDPDLLDLAQHAVSADCQLTGFPYVLARAHELAVVSHAERGQFEEMLGQFMLRNGLTPATSFKAGMKGLTAGRGRQLK